MEKIFCQTELSGRLSWDEEGECRRLRTPTANSANDVTCTNPPQRKSCLLCS